MRTTMQLAPLNNAYSCHENVKLLLRSGNKSVCSEFHFFAVRHYCGRIRAGNILNSGPQGWNISGEGGIKTYLNRTLSMIYPIGDFTMTKYYKQETLRQNLRLCSFASTKFESQIGLLVLAKPSLRWQHHFIHDRICAWCT